MNMIDEKYSECTQLFVFSHKTVVNASVLIISIASILGNIGQNIVRQSVRE